MNLLAAFEVLIYFDVLALISRKVSRKRQEVMQNKVNLTLIGMVFHLVQKAWNALTKSYLFGPLQAFKKPYMWLDPVLM